MGEGCYASCGILVPQPGIEPMPLAVKAQNLNHRTTGEVPTVGIYWRFSQAEKLGQCSRVAESPPGRFLWRRPVLPWDQKATYMFQDRKGSRG